VPGAEQGRRLAPGDCFGGNLDRRPRFAAQRRGGRLLHRHHVGGVDDLHARRIDVRVPGELCIDRGRVADERDTDIEMRERGHGAGNDLARGVIAAHGVHCDPDHLVQGSAFMVQGSGFRVLVWAPSTEP
jgi:hypothetical protein